MRIHHAVATVACGFALASATTVVAEAAAPPEGRPCGFTFVETSPPAGDSWQGEIDGGPVVATGGEPVALTCAVHVNGPLHSDPAAVSLTGPRLPGLGVVAPAPVSFHVDRFDSVVVCTSATVGSTTWYWDGGAWSGDSGTACPGNDPYWPWSAVPWDVVPWEEVPGSRSAICLAFSVIGPGSYDCLPMLYEDLSVVDRVLCANLVALDLDIPGVVDTRADGDLWVLGGHVWDCPPYA